MNWHLIYAKLYPIVVGLVIVLLSYSLPPAFMKYERKSKIKAATLKEKLWGYLRVISICVLFAGVASRSSLKDEDSYFVIWMALTIIPSVISLMIYFESEAKMTEEERLKLRRDLKRAERESRHYPDY